MSIDFTVKASENSPLPPASYYAVFKSVLPFDNDKIDGQRLKWLWEVTSGPCKGREATALTDATFSQGNKAGKFVSGMLGRALVDGEKLGQVIEGLKGQRFAVRVAAGPKGGKVSVQDVSLPPEE